MLQLLWYWREIKSKFAYLLTAKSPFPSHCFYTTFSTEIAKFSGFTVWVQQVHDWWNSDRSMKYWVSYLRNINMTPLGLMSHTFTTQINCLIWWNFCSLLNWKSHMPSLMSVKAVCLMPYLAKIIIDIKTRLVLFLLNISILAKQTKP